MTIAVNVFKNEDIVVSGLIQFIHGHHILKSCKKIGDYLMVAFNSDEWLINKKKVFMHLKKERISYQY